MPRARVDLTGIQPDRGGWRAWVWAGKRNISGIRK